MHRFGGCVNVFCHTSSLQASDTPLSPIRDPFTSSVAGPASNRTRHFDSVFQNSSL